MTTRQQIKTRLAELEGQAEDARLQLKDAERAVSEAKEELEKFNTDPALVYVTQKRLVPSFAACAIEAFNAGRASVAELGGVVAENCGDTWVDHAGDSLIIDKRSRTFVQVSVQTQDEIIVWVSLTADQAVEVAKTLLHRAAQLRESCKN